jgi:hypothetical protein
VSDQITPGMIQTIVRATKQIGAAAERLPALLERIAVALEAQAAAHDWSGERRPGHDQPAGRRVVRTYECENGASASVCRLCVAPLGSVHDPACPYNRIGGR